MYYYKVIIKTDNFITLNKIMFFYKDTLAKDWFLYYLKILIFAKIPNMININKLLSTIYIYGINI